jgi:hypothetical protein
MAVTMVHTYQPIITFRKFSRCVKQTLEGILPSESIPALIEYTSEWLYY